MAIFSKAAVDDLKSKLDSVGYENMTASELLVLVSDQSDDLARIIHGPA